MYTVATYTTSAPVVDSSVMVIKSNLSVIESVRRPEPVFDLSSNGVSNWWHMAAPQTIVINSYAKGITLSRHNSSDLNRSHLLLRTREQRINSAAPEGNYFLFREDAEDKLTDTLRELDRSGILANSTLVFGTSSDPFLNFHTKFDTTLTCLRLIERFRAALVIVQTRSPLVIAGIPSINELRERCIVSMPIETTKEAAIIRYTPHQPRLSERISAIQGLRIQGIQVALDVAPLLPYGSYWGDAHRFAEVLRSNSDYITMNSVDPSEETHLGKALALDNEELYLKEDAVKALYLALSKIAPEKIKLDLEGYVMKDSSIANAHVSNG